MDFFEREIGDSLERMYDHNYDGVLDNGERAFMYNDIEEEDREISGEYDDYDDDDDDDEEDDD